MNEFETVVKEYQDVSFLVVEDDDLDFKAVLRGLHKLKLSNPVIRAMDGVEALQILRGESGHDNIKRPYIILLDINMPRMNGIEFLDNLRADNNLQKDVVFVLTSSRLEEDIVKSYERHIAGYITKSDPTVGIEEALKMIDHYWRVVLPPVNKL